MRLLCGCIARGEVAIGWGKAGGVFGGGGDKRVVDASGLLIGGAVGDVSSCFTSSCLMPSRFKSGVM